MKISLLTAQLYLRLALGTGFILPVMDRLGWHAVAWGNWPNFVTYTWKLLPFMARKSAEIMGFAATLLEGVIGIFLIIGYKIRETAIGSFALTLTFALCMAWSISFRLPFNYSVFTDSAGALLLAFMHPYPWSLDHFISKINKPHSYEN